jgi:hypothetical protein
MSEHKWQKSSFSEGGSVNCVELAASGPPMLLIRESEDPATVLSTTPARLRWLLDAIRSGELDV